MAFITSQKLITKVNKNTEYDISIHVKCGEPVLKGSGSALASMSSEGAEDMTTGFNITIMSFQGTTTVRLIG